MYNTVLFLLGLHLIFNAPDEVFECCALTHFSPKPCVIPWCCTILHSAAIFRIFRIVYVML